MSGVSANSMNTLTEGLGNSTLYGLSPDVRGRGTPPSMDYTRMSGVSMDILTEGRDV